MAQSLTDFSSQHQKCLQKHFSGNISPNGMSHTKEDIKQHLLIQELCHSFVSCSTLICFRIVWLVTV